MDKPGQVFRVGPSDPGNGHVELVSSETAPPPAERTISSQKVNEALRTFLQLGKPDTVLDGNIDPMLVDEIFSQIATGCFSEDTAECLFSSLILATNKVSAFASEMDTPSSDAALKFVLNLVESPTSHVASRLRGLRLLTSQTFSKTQLEQCETQLLSCARNINVSEDWALKHEAVGFYMRLATKCQCGKLLFKNRIDFLFPLLEEYPPEHKMFMAEYLCQILCSEDRVLIDICESLTLEGIKRLLDRNFDPNNEVWFKILVNLLRLKEGSECIASNTTLCFMVKKFRGQSDFALICFEKLYGLDQVQDAEYEEYIVRMLRLVELRLFRSGVTRKGDDDARSFLPSSTNGPKRSKVTRKNRLIQAKKLLQDDFHFGYRLISPLGSILNMMKSKPIEKTCVLTSKFLANRLIGKIVQVGFDTSDSRLLLSGIEICFRLGFRTQDRESIYRCFDRNSRSRLERIRNPNMLGSEDMERVMEICSWRPKAADANTDALHAVTGCPTQQCEKLLRIHHLDLSTTIKNFFHVKNHLNIDDNRDVMDRILAQARGDNTESEEDSCDEDEDRPANSAVAAALQDSSVV